MEEIMKYTFRINDKGRLERKIAIKKKGLNNTNRRIWDSTFVKSNASTVYERCMEITGTLEDITSIDSSELKDYGINARKKDLQFWILTLSYQNNGVTEREGVIFPYRKSNGLDEITAELHLYEEPVVYTFKSIKECGTINETKYVFILEVNGGLYKGKKFLTTIKK